MDDKCIMENLLHNTKAACDLYMHGTIEAPTVGVRQAFCAALNDTLTMQDTIYNQMASKGWYTTEQAPQQKVEQLKQKYSAMG